MKNKLQLHFPMIRSEEELLEEIKSQENLLKMFRTWNEEQREEFLKLCTGVKGVKLLYDSFFKEIINPTATPERLEELLSLLLGQRVRILKVLPNESARIAAEKSLLIMDIVVQLENESIANVEVQKIGYAFPGQRSACYSADLLLRQYKRLRGAKGKRFSYRDIKKVYNIVLFETSAGEFHKHPECYIHRAKQRFDSGLSIELLQEYIFVPLDIFKKILHNRNIDIKNKLEAWLTFLSVDEPEVILKMIEAYPEFKPLYQEVYELCRDLEKVMNMFSRELAELDRNTVQYMIDEMQDKIDEQGSKLKEKDQEIHEQSRELKEKDQEIHEQSQQREKSIQSLIQSLKAQGRPNSEILKMLGTVFGLTPEEAKARLR